jgi:hypothetical protein
MRARYQRNQLKRFSPAVILALAAACVILLDAVVVVVPQALADPKASAIASIQSVVAAASPSVDLSSEATVDTTNPDTSNFYVPTPAPSTPTPATPAPTKLLAVKAAPKPKPKYRDTVANARIYLKNRIGVAQYNCINIVWYHESRWSWRATNPNSGAYGIPQAYPGNKMAAYGSNWRTSPLTQVKWGLWYVTSRYGSACGAYAFWKAHHWY